MRLWWCVEETQMCLPWAPTHMAVSEWETQEVLSNHAEWTLSAAKVCVYVWHQYACTRHSGLNVMHANMNGMDTCTT